MFCYAEAIIKKYLVRFLSHLIISDPKVLLGWLSYTTTLK